MKTTTDVDPTTKRDAGDIVKTAALRSLIGETFRLRFAGKVAYGVVAFASDRRVVVNFRDGRRHQFTPFSFFNAAN